MAKIVMGNKTQHTNHFELGYTFTLDIPVLQQGKDSQTTTTDISGVVPYDNNTSLDAIKSDLVKRFNVEQENLNNNTKLSLYGITWDGTKWL